jgi:hypothetical protein
MCRPARLRNKAFICSDRLLIGDLHVRDEYRAAPSAGASVAPMWPPIAFFHQSCHVIPQVNPKPLLRRGMESHDLREENAVLRLRIEYVESKLRGFVRALTFDEHRDHVVKFDEYRDYVLRFIESHKEIMTFVEFHQQSRYSSNLTT